MEWGGDVYCTRGWFCDDHVFFFTSNKKTWVEKKKHAAFGEGFLVTANWVEAFFLPPYTSQMEFNWSAYTSPVSKLQHGGGPPLRGEAFLFGGSWDNVFGVWVQMIDLYVRIPKMWRSQQIDVLFQYFLCVSFMDFDICLFRFGGVELSLPAQ